MQELTLQLKLQHKFDVSTGESVQLRLRKQQSWRDTTQSYMPKNERVYLHDVKLGRDAKVVTSRVRSLLYRPSDTLTKVASISCDSFFF